MKRSIMMFVVLSSVALVLSACGGAVRRMPHYSDANNPLKRIAVLPLKNDTNDVDAPGAVRKKMIEALENRSYVVKDVKETDQLLRDQMGITLGGQLDMTTPQKLGEVLGVEGVLYGTLMDFDESNTGILDVRKVRAKFRLVNTSTASALWERGLGIRSETRMAGRTGKVASVVARGSDARDKEVPWVTIESHSSGESNVGKAFAIGLGAKMLTKAIGIHLEYETKEMVNRLFDTIPWGPGAYAAAPSVPVSVPKIAVPAVAMPATPSFGYLDYGTRDFTAVLIAETVTKDSKETVRFEMPVAKAGDRFRMEMDLASMGKTGEGMPPALSKMTTIHRGDKKVSYTLYDNSRKYIIHQQTSVAGQGEKPQIAKTKVGSEVIDGHPTDKYQVTISYKNGRTDEGFFWNARDLNDMTIRSEIENKDSRVVTELKRISLRSPDLSLFEIPAGYGETKNFMELMSGAH